MIKNVMNLFAVLALISAISCKKNDQPGVQLDAENMIVPQERVVSGTSAIGSGERKANPGDYPKIEIENADFDFGVINEGDKAEHIFKFKNTGKGDLVIANATASCGCTVPEWTKEPIKAGESGQVKIIFNSAGKPGQQQKTVTLTTNTEAGQELIHFKATVTPKTK
jgi:hypothetical protein